MTNSMRDSVAALLAQGCSMVHTWPIKTLMVFAALYPFYELSRKDWAKLTSSVEFKSEIATKER
jgi:hypothetical protein